MYFYSRIVEPRQVRVIEEQLIRNSNETTITWQPLNRDCDGISPEYFLNFSQNNFLVYTTNTTNNSVSCNSVCKNATSFIIWAVVEGENWGETLYNLTAIADGKIYLIFY